MDNPFDKKSTDAAPKAGDSPVEKKLTSAVEPKKKKGLSVGKIISIFAGLVLVGVVVGTLMYSQSGDRLKGAAGTMPAGSVQQPAADYDFLTDPVAISVAGSWVGDEFAHTLCLTKDINILCQDDRMFSYCPGEFPEIIIDNQGNPQGTIEGAGNCGSITSYFEVADYCDLTVSNLISLEANQNNWLLSAADKALLAVGTDEFYAEKCDEVISGSMECVVNTQGTPYSCECPTGEELNSNGDACEVVIPTCDPLLNEFLNTSNACEACPAGEEVNTAGDGCDVAIPTCDPLLNEFLNASNACEACPAGEEVNTAGDGCECAVGYTLDPVTNVCEADPVIPTCTNLQEYLDIGTNTCTPCGDNKRQNPIDQTATCLECAAGEIATATGCEVCPAGEEVDPATWTCVVTQPTCSAHEIEDTASPTGCTECAAEEVATATGCELCPTGESVNSAWACEAFTCNNDEIIDGNTCTACQVGEEPNSNQSACISSTLTCTAPDYMNAAGDACAVPSGTDTICTDLTALKDEMKTFYSSAVEGTEDWTQYDANLNDIISILSNNPGHADLELIDPLDPNYCEGFSDCDLEYDLAVSGFGNLDLDLTLSNVYQDRSAGVLNSCYTYEDICTFSKLTANELSKESSISPLQEAGFREMLITCKDEVPAAATKAGYLQDIVDYIRDLFASNNTSYIAQLFPTAYAAAGDLSIPVMDIIDDVYAVTTTTTSNTSSGGSSSGSAGGRPSGGTATSSAGHGAATGEECRSLEISAPGAAVGDAPTVTISEDGYLSEMLQISVDADSGAVNDYRYKSLNGTITFNGVDSEYDSAAEVVYMDGAPAAGESDTITVWARDAGGNGIPTCNDSFTVQVEGVVAPPEPVVVEPVAILPEEPHTAAAEVEVPEPIIIAATQEVPEQPLTGPGVLIYLVGAGVGSALWNRRKRK